MSPFASVAVAVNVNGVRLGILKIEPPTLATTGGVLPVAVVAAHVFPLPV